MPILTVIARSKFGRTRAGTRFTREPVTVEIDDDQAALIDADSMLVVQEDSRTPAPAVVSEPTPAPKAKR
jgi:hypothetical protein